jgi:hypothetical protein
MKKENPKVLCEDFRCGWHGVLSESLTAAHPFIAGETIRGCPKCKTLQDFLAACDEPECWQAATCGTPTPKGYRQTCFQHLPRDSK